MQTERIEVRVTGELRTLIPRFLANREADVLQLEKALKQRDFEVLRRIGHILKGAGGGYGFADISTIGDAIERAAKSGEFETLEREVGALKRYLECVHIVFE